MAQEYAELSSIYARDLPSGWEDALPTFTPEDKALATRLHSQTMLNALANVLPGGPPHPTVAPMIYRKAMPASCAAWLQYFRANNVFAGYRAAGAVPV